MTLEPGQVSDAKVKVLVRKEWDLETWDGVICTDTLENPESSDSPELSGPAEMAQSPLLKR